MMIEKDFLMARALVMNANENVLKIGIVNYLKELEKQWNDSIDTHSIETHDPDECEGCIPLYTPWEVADSIAQFTFFTKRYEIDNMGTTYTFGLTEEEIEQQIQEFMDKLNDEEDK